MRQINFCTMIIGTVLLTILSSPAIARIKLITLPVRQRVEIQLDNDQATLVEEERIVPLVEGVNQVDFSWANTQIDPNTVVFRAVGSGESADDDTARLINVLSVSYPPGENALVWQVSSNQSGSVRVRISYILGSLNKSFHYRAVAANDETTLTFAQYMRLQNFANESFGNSNIWAGFGPDFTKPVGINETKEMLVAKFRNVSIKKTYTCNPAEFDYIDRPKNKLRVPMHYVLRNSRDRQFGQAPWPYGKVRIFQDDGRGTTAFLGEDWGQFTPIDGQMKLYLGVAQDIVVKRTIEKSDRQRVAGNLFHHEVVIKYEIENFKNQKVTLDLAEDLGMIRNEALGGDSDRDVEWQIGELTTLSDPDKEETFHQRVLFHVDLDGADGGKADKIVHKLHILIKNEW